MGTELSDQRLAKQSIQRDKSMFHNKAEIFSLRCRGDKCCLEF